MHLPLILVQAWPFLDADDAAAAAESSSGGGGDSSSSSSGKAEKGQYEPMMEDGEWPPAVATGLQYLFEHLKSVSVSL